MMRWLIIPASASLAISEKVMLRLIVPVKGTKVPFARGEKVAVAAAMASAVGVPRAKKSGMMDAAR